jgi:lipoprotein-anchoring transpeptidase ErfK/SrfK
VQADQVVGIPGKEGRVLDVGQTIEHLQQDVVTVVRRRRLDLIMQPLLPDFTDPDPFLPQAQRVIGQSLLLSGYDPYTNETINWSTSPDSLASWLEASPSGLTLREDAYLPFLDAQTASLNPNGDNLRFLEPGETMDAIRGAIARNEPSVRLRIRYRPTVYEVESGDRATAVARRNGIPYFLVEEANPGRDLNVLSVGDKINLPSRDVAVPLPPIPNKRIVVDISTQHLVAYENGQMIYDWDVSTGISSAPTAPGVYQILTHNDLAYGSTFSLCGSAGCGQWTMHWFMGIYEVTNGLMNGLHGAVELPDGRYLGGGNVGHPYTYGCVMSLDSNAKELYDWADEGTLVEIISNEYPPQSDLARQVAAADHLATT